MMADPVSAAMAPHIAAVSGSKESVRAFKEWFLAEVSGAVSKDATAGRAHVEGLVRALRKHSQLGEHGFQPGYCSPQTFTSLQRTRTRGACTAATW
jgi:hypothetical protein